jgi:hypothetical protein
MTPANFPALKRLPMNARLKMAEELWDQSLPPETKAAARKTYRIFQQNPGHPSLHLERLASDPRAWSVRVTLNYRAIALRVGDAWIWFWIGTHQEFDRQFPR